jgi:hypothetical protein
VDDDQFDDSELGVAGFTLPGTGGDVTVGGRRLVLALPEGTLHRDCWIRTEPLEHEEQVIDLHVSGQFLTKQPEEVAKV